MKYLITSVIILIVSIFTIINSPAKAGLKEIYVFTPVDTIVKLEDIKAVHTNVYWECLECIEDTINQYHKYGNEAASIAYKQYIRAGVIASVESGFVPVVFVKEYKGFWIFKIDR